MILPWSGGSTTRGSGQSCARDVIRLDGKLCRVVRVSQCSAVVAVSKQPREFTTLFGVRVRIQPKPGLVRISPHSEVPILNR
jgi:hypothetical protein